MNLKETNDFEIIDLGVMEEWVYDIEVENNHNFFGNNILLHNSIYFSLGDNPKFIRDINNNATTLEDCDNYIETVIQPVINDCIKEFANIFNSIENHAIGMKREIIFKNCVFLAKKKYFMRVLDSEGVPYLDEKNPKIKKIGIDLVKSTTPKFVQSKLEESALIILEKSEKELKDWLNKVKWEFSKQPLSDIARISGVNRLDYDLLKDNVPINSRSCIVSNQYIKNNNLDNQFNYLTTQDKVKMMYLKMPNPLNSNSFAFNDEKFAQIFKKYIDYDMNFDKLFLNPLKLMTEPLNYNLKDNKEELDEW